ncbi:MAG: argS [Planctomycetaceae bacterium]|nr:argS [Planctomycetaceae bacterium]
MNILAEIRSRFASVLSVYTDQPAQYLEMIRPVEDSRHGDYQANFAMKLAKLCNQNPRDLALAVAAKIELSDICAPPDVAGPGFINLRLSDGWLGTEINRMAADDREGVAPVVSPKTYVVDFSGPNVAKPMHVGHLRSTVIGDAICRILRFLGHQVLGDNHIGDWGTQFGMIIYGYKHFLNQAAFEQDAVLELARLYRFVNQLCDYHDLRALQPKLDKGLAEKLEEIDAAAAAPGDEKQKQKLQKKLTGELEVIREQIADSRKKLSTVESNPQVEALARQHPEIAVKSRLETAKLHGGDPENLKLWNQFVPACLDAIQGVYDRLNIHFDLSLGESYYQPQLAAVVADLKEKGLARESEGAMCVFIPGTETPFIVQKTDGAFTYATTDLATIKYRRQPLHADAMLYVVDTRQSEHFKMLFETARLWGYGAVEFKHVNFGTILGEDGKPYKTRSGDTVGLESLLDEAVGEALKVIESEELANGEDRPKLAADVKQRVAEIIGLGGIKYADLKHNRESDYKYSLKKMLAKEGDTATYMQYAYARVCGIFRKCDVERDVVRQSPDRIVLSHSKERNLAVQLARFGEILESAMSEYRPNILTDYLFQTANAFSSFYDECSVRDAETPELRASRLRLVDLTARVLARGLELLGIETIEQM